MVGAKKTKVQYAQGIEITAQLSLGTNWLILRFTPLLSDFLVHFRAQGLDQYFRLIRYHIHHIQSWEGHDAKTTES